MKSVTVQQLREQGCRVRVEHIRNLVPVPNLGAARRSAMMDFNVSPRGGITKVRIEFPNGAVYSGEAVCSEADNYNKRVGVQLSIQRALIKKRIDDGQRSMDMGEMMRRQVPPQERAEYNS